MQGDSPEVLVESLRAVPYREIMARKRETWPRLVRMLRHAHPLVRQEAVLRLAWFGDEARSEYATLRTLATTDPDASVRDNALDTILQIHNSAPLLRQLLRESCAPLRKGALIRLCRSSGDAKEALPVLLQLAKEDDDPDIRTLAHSLATRSR
jgi:HEAT repeat protein